jgi:hypothetical protein
MISTVKEKIFCANGGIYQDGGSLHDNYLAHLRRFEINYVLPNEKYIWPFYLLSIL